MAPWTAAASGAAGYESLQMLGVFAPAKTPAVIVERLNREIVRALAQPDVKTKFVAAEIGRAHV